MLVGIVERVPGAACGNVVGVGPACLPLRHALPSGRLTLASATEDAGACDPGGVAGDDERVVDGNVADA